MREAGYAAGLHVITKLYEHFWKRRVGFMAVFKR